jgi:predicted MPP superfamily phosphohydrolase
MVTARQAHSRPEDGRGTISRRTALKALAGIGIGGLTGGAAYGFFYGREALGLTRIDVPVHSLPPHLSGLRIGLITDVHRSRWVTADDVAAAVALLIAAKPDLIVLGGDYVTWGDRQYVGAAAEALSGLAAPYGVFAILGNHDDDHDMPAALAKHKVQVLRDARTRVTIGEGALELVGIRFWTKRQVDIAALMRGAQDPVVLLAHDPRRFTEAAALNVPLVLSGHTHGGQVVLPAVGAIAARKFPVVAGLARRDRTTMFVSRGLGTVYVPIRINCPPEVALLTLQSENLPRNV